jgi:hypothetical protein
MKIEDLRYSVVLISTQSSKEQQSKQDSAMWYSKMPYGAIDIY